MKKNAAMPAKKVPAFSSKTKLLLLLACLALLVAALLWGILGSASQQRRLEHMMMRMLTVPNTDLAALLEPYDSVDEALEVVTQQDLQLALAGALGEFADAQALEQPVIAYEVLGVHVSALVLGYTILPRSVTVTPMDTTGQYEYEARLLLHIAALENEPLTLSGRIFVNTDGHVTYLDVGMSVLDLVAYYPE